MVFWERFTNWLKQPYADEMDAFGLFLFAGLMAIFAIAWGSIIRKVAE